MKEILSFLKKLKRNNEREWFEARKQEYIFAKEQYEQFLDALLPEIRKFDKAIEPSQTGKACMFRIYKDVRFSKDKTPYKTHLGASINPGGRKSPEAGYYLHIEPGNSFLAGGVWQPEPAVLAVIRQEIDYNPKDLHRILRSSSFSKWYQGFDEEGSLVTAPKGYDKDHPDIHIIKNRHFIVSHLFSDAQVTSASFKKLVAGGFKAMHPLMKYLRTAAHTGD